MYSKAFFSFCHFSHCFGGIQFSFFYFVDRVLFYLFWPSQVKTEITTLTSQTFCYRVPKGINLRTWHLQLSRSVAFSSTVGFHFVGQTIAFRFHFYLSFCTIPNIACTIGLRVLVIHTLICLKTLENYVHFFYVLKMLLYSIYIF